MTFLIGLLVWVLVLGVCFSIALYAIRQLEWIAPPFKSVAIAILCLIAIVVLLGFVTGQVPMPGVVVLAPHR